MGATAPPSGMNGLPSGSAMGATAPPSGMNGLPPGSAMGATAPPSGMNITNGISVSYLLRQILYRLRRWPRPCGLYRRRFR